MKILVTKLEKSGVSLLTAAFLHSFFPESIIYIQESDSLENISEEVRQLLYESFIDPYPVFQIITAELAYAGSFHAAIVFSKDKKENVPKLGKIDSNNIYHIDILNYNIGETNTMNEWYSLGDYIKEQTFFIFKTLVNKKQESK